MVKGVSRRIVVVESPDEKLFEEAIFIVRNDAFGEGVTAAALVQEARRVAKNCAAGNASSLAKRISPQLSAALGAATVGIAWLAVTFFT